MRAMQETSVHETKWQRAAKRTAVAGVCAVFGLTLSACSSKPKVDASAELVAPAPAPRIVSGDAEADAPAYGATVDSLSGVQFGLIEKNAPKAVHPRGRDKGAATATATGTAETQTEAAEIAAPVPQTREDRTAAVERSSTISTLPDGQLRIVYSLKHYGGSTVTAARDGGTSRRNVVTKPADLAPLIAVLKEHVGGAGAIAALPSENALVITIPAELRQSLFDVLGTLDQSPRQVEITARIFEVSSDFDFQQGARTLLRRIGSESTQTGFSTFDTARLMDPSGAAPFQGSAIGLMKLFEGEGISMAASFQILAEEGLVKLVSSPRMTVSQGQTGYMLAGQELPIQQANIVNGALQVATSYKPVGVQLYITPQAMSADSVKLHVITTVSAISGFASMPTLTGQRASASVNSLLVNPIIDAREAETAVTVENGNTLVISGMRMMRTTTRENKVPFLGDVPLVGWLFKNHREQKQMTDLYFFVTPAIL